jgi:GTP 3',8-cyclase
MTGLSDSFQRPINYLRVSVTDRCNLRCIYCMPENGVTQIPHQDILTYEEIHLIVRLASELGINKVRITGGEPLVRLGLSELVKLIAGIDTIDDVSITTNGILLPRYAAELKQAGLKQVNISLDTLKSDKFRQITRNGELDDVLKGIEMAKAVGLEPVKINVVAIAGVNDDEIIDFARKTIDDDWHVRFIELMPVSGRDEDAAKVISARDIKKMLDPLGKMEPYKPSVGNGPAKYFRFHDAEGTIGFITPVSEHFCFSCNRVRLTADGKLRPCLMSESEFDLREPLRNGVTTQELKKLIKTAVESKPLQHTLSEGYRPDGRPFCQVGG